MEIEALVVLVPMGTAPPMEIAATVEIAPPMETVGIAVTVLPTVIVGIAATVLLMETVEIAATVPMGIALMAIVLMVIVRMATEATALFVLVQRGVVLVESVVLGIQMVQVVMAVPVAPVAPVVLGAPAAVVLVVVVWEGAHPVGKRGSLHSKTSAKCPTAAMMKKKAAMSVV